MDFLKMDCEGAEWRLFEDKEIWRKVENLSMEYHLWPEHTHEEAWSVVHGLGFTVKSQTRYEGFGLIIASRS